MPIECYICNNNKKCHVVHTFFQSIVVCFPTKTDRLMAQMCARLFVIALQQDTALMRNNNNEKNHAFTGVEKNNTCIIPAGSRQQRAGYEAH